LACARRVTGEQQPNTPRRHKAERTCRKPCTGTGSTRFWRMSTTCHLTHRAAYSSRNKAHSSPGRRRGVGPAARGGHAVLPVALALVRRRRLVCSPPRLPLPLASAGLASVRRRLRPRVRRSRVAAGTCGQSQLGFRGFGLGPEVNLKARSPLTLISRAIGVGVMCTESGRGSTRRKLQNLRPTLHRRTADCDGCLVLSRRWLWECRTLSPPEHSEATT
jgi:hypothetical protein